MAPADDLERRISGIATLDQPLRRDLYRLLSERDGWMTRDQASEALGVPRSVAAFHLDKLADAGVVETTFERTTGRTGPGAGRPAKLYRRSDREIEVSLPQREYDLAGALLAGAIDAADSSGRPVRAELERSSYAFGRTMGERAKERAGARPSRAKQRDALLEVLREHGFEPRVVGRDVVLANCPFHALSQQFTELVCGMNLHLLEGVRSVLDVGATELQPRLEPEPGQCCVKFCSVA